MNCHRFPKSSLATAVAFLVAAFPAAGAEFDVADGKLSIKGSVFLGTVNRTDSRDPELIASPNAALVGATSTNAGGKNQDDGNLNFNKGNAVSKTIKGSLDAEYKRGNYGLVGRIKAWSDFALTDDARAWGNLPNNFAAGQPLSDNGFARRSKFSGILFDDVYAFGNASVGNAPLEWKIGQQRLTWGTQFTIAGGLGDLSPRDLPAQRRAGALPEDGRIPVPAVTGKLAVTPSTTLDAFAQFGFRPNAANGCGTFFSASDFLADGCNKALLGAASDRASLAGGAFVKRGANDMPSDSGQAGLGIRQKIETIGAEMGAYVAQYHSRSAYFSAIKSQRTAGAPFLPNDPGGLNPQYFIEYPENIRVLGLTFDKKLAAGSVTAELTYRPNQPYQYNALDLLNAFATAAGPTPLRAAATATAPGSVFTGYERHKAVQLNIGATHALPAMLGAAGATIGGEFAYKGVPGLPDQSIVRFRRSDVFGQAPVGGAACPAGTAAKTCSSDGYVSASAYAYRLRFGLRYPQIVNGVDFLPTVVFGHDVKGWSEDSAIVQGRKFAILSLKAVLQKSFVAELAWQPTWGGAYNNLRDRSTVAASIGYQF